MVFSSSYELYLSPHTTMNAQQFSEFLQQAGGSQGHAVLYLLPIPDLSDLLEPEYSCLAKLSESNTFLLTVSDTWQVVPSSSIIEDHVPPPPPLLSPVFAVEDGPGCVDLIFEHKLTDEIVKGISYLQAQQQRQKSGLDIFR